MGAQRQPATGRRASRVASRALQWGPLGPVEAANAFRIYYLPFVEPLDIDTPLINNLLAILGPLTPIVVGLITLWIQSQINSFRREQEGKVAGAAASAVGSAASSAAQSAAGSVLDRLRQLPPEQWLKLFACLAIDLAGDASFLLPGLGEFADVAYAPVEAGLLRFLFGGNVLAFIGFLEEGLPFSDAVPTASSAWVLQSLFPESPLSAFLGIQPPPLRKMPDAPEKEKKAPGEAEKKAKEEGKKGS